MKGNLIIISSPSGGGKGTLIRTVLDTVPDIGYSVSWTTRAPRSGEENLKDYCFVSKEEFERHRAEGGFLEFAEVHGNLYGTSKKQIDQITNEGRDIILEIDVQGAEAVLKQVPGAVSIFILPPSFETLRARLIARATEGSDDLAVRLRNSHYEVAQYSRFKYVVINDEVNSAARRLASVVIAQRQQKDRQTDAIQVILDSFERSKS